MAKQREGILVAALSRSRSRAEEWRLQETHDVNCWRMSVGEKGRSHGNGMFGMRFVCSSNQTSFLPDPVSY